MIASHYQTDLEGASSATPEQVRDIYKRWFGRPGQLLWLDHAQQRKLAEFLLHREGLAAAEKELICRRYKLAQRD